MRNSISSPLQLQPYSNSELPSKIRTSVCRLGQILKLDTSKESKISPIAQRFYTQYMKSFSRTGLFTESDNAKKIRGIVLGPILIIDADKNKSEEFQQGISNINKSFRENGLDVQVIGSFNDETSLYYVTTDA